MELSWQAVGGMMPRWSPASRAEPQATQTGIGHIQVVLQAAWYAPIKMVLLEAQLCQ